jgi:hypothetical protein
MVRIRFRPEELIAHGVGSAYVTETGSGCLEVGVPTSSRQHQQVVVGSKPEFDAAVQHYIASGFGPRQMSNELAILTTVNPQKSLGCGFVFWCVVFFPVAIIMLVNRSKDRGERSITIRLQQASAPTLVAQPSVPAPLRMSEDRQSWWDGEDWVRVDQAPPPNARRSADGNLWWDGQQWRAIS